MPPPLLTVKNLATSFATDAGVVKAVDGVSFTVQKGQTLGIVGESGCGKTVTALAIARLLPKPSARIDAGEVVLDGVDLLKLPKAELYKVRGERIAMIFQEPMAALNPVHSIGKQLGEMFRLHRPELRRAEIVERCLELLKRVGIPAAKRRMRDFPHQLSGGMRQRVMIAMALACEPDILIADEPTTALDVTIQAQILELMRTLQDETGMAIIFITHDLGVIAGVCDEVAVMYGGQIVEQASVAELFRAPRHPYTRGLLASIVRLNGASKVGLPTIKGMVPSLFEMPSGCRFQNRCPHVTDACQQTVQVLQDTGSGDHSVRCMRWRDL